MPKKSKKQRKEDDEDEEADYGDDISDLGADDTQYGGGTTANNGNNGGNLRFKYSTENMAENSRWNNKCYLIAIAVVFVIVAIVVGVLFARLGKSNDNSDSVGQPTPSPTLSPNDPNANNLGLDLFKATEEYISTQCEEDDLRTCRSECENFECCDPTIADVKQSCFYNNPIGCLNYQKCHVLNQQFDTAPSNLNAICSPNAITNNNRKPCEDACATVQCCWDPTAKNCQSTNFYGCLDYAACQHLTAATKNVPTPTNRIKLQEVCKSSSTGYDKDTCTSMCEPAKCCGGDCFFNNMMTCFLYEPSCKHIKFPLPIAGNQVPIDDNEITNVCSSTNFATNPSECETECTKSNSCCRNNSTCSNTVDPFGCLHYERCFDLFP